MQKFFKFIFSITLIYGALVATISLFMPSYLDHVAPLIAITSWVSLKQGLPLFHAADFSSIYNLMYGPLVFMSHWPAFWLLGGSFFASKITSCLFFFGSLFLFCRLLKLTVPEHLKYILGFYFLSWILNCDDFFYNNRTDAFLLFWSLFAAAIFWSQRLPSRNKRLSPWIQLILTTIAAALCFNYKIHGVLYVAPVVGVLSIKNAKSFLTALGIFIVVAALPWLFLPGQFSIYFGILKNLSRVMGHTEIRQVIVMNLTTMALFFALCRPHFKKENRWLLIFSMITIVFGSLFAMREGSGKNQVIPIIPSYLAFFASAELRTFQKKYAWLAITVALYLTACLIKNQKDLMTYFSQYSTLEAKKEEITSLAKDLPNHSVLWAYSTASYYDSYLRPQIYFMNKGSDFMTDAVTLMENVHGGIPFPSAAIERLASCQTEYTIFPGKASPGESHSFYDNSNVFPAEWMSTLQSHYQKVSETEHYSLWKCH